MTSIGSYCSVRYTKKRQDVIIGLKSSVSDNLLGDENDLFLHEHDKHLASAFYKVTRRSLFPSSVLKTRACENRSTKRSGIYPSDACAVDCARIAFRPVVDFSFRKQQT